MPLSGNEKRIIQAIQILKCLRKRHKSTQQAVLEELNLTAGEYDDIIEDTLREMVLDELVECGCCGCYHQPEFAGDCREDYERF